MLTFLVRFKSPSPTYIATYDNSSGSLFITWYTTGGAQVNIFGETTSAYVGSVFAFGDTVYWIQDETDSTPSHPNSTVFSVSASASYPTAKRLTGSIAPSAYKIIDANALSLLFAGTGGLYRVALPDGAAAHDPQLVVGPPSSSGSVIAATEDAAGVYWFEYDGTLYSCSLSNCSGSKKALASGQVLGGTTNVVWPAPLYQDSSALYWGDFGTNRLMRLVK